MTQLNERIELEAPLSGDFQAVIRLIIGGIAERVDFAFEEIDDLQLAVERLLAEEEMYALVVDPAEGCDTGTPAAWAATNARMVLEDESQREAFLEAFGSDFGAALG